MRSGSFSTLLRIAAQHMPLNFLRLIFLRAGGTKIGKGTLIERNVKIGPNMTIGKECDIRRLSKFHDCRIGDRVKVDEFAIINYAHIGDDCEINRGAILYGSSEGWAKIGKDVLIGVNWIVDGTGGLEVDDHVSMGSHLGGIFTHSGLRKRLLGHPFKGNEFIERSPVRIGTCSWIGGKVTIQLGVTIGDHSVVLPNSTVINEVKPYTMVSGVPAQPIKRIVIENGKVVFLPLED
jgi:acetyltransferase-like isoleucine patch superfamily enzyme